MGNNITDNDRLKALRLLFAKDESNLPFSRQKLEYLKPLSRKLSQLTIGNGLEEYHSSIMLREMIDELLVEITAQINWSIGETGTGTTNKRVLSKYGLNPWNRIFTSSITQPAQVA